MMGWKLDILFVLVLVISLMGLHEMIHFVIIQDNGCYDARLIWTGVGPGVEYDNSCFPTAEAAENTRYMNQLFHIIFYSLHPIFLLLGLIFMAVTGRRGSNGI